MRSIDARFHGPVRVLLGSLILIVGCHGARARAPEPRSGAAFEEPAGGALASYGAWTRHTGGAAGEDLFADPLPVGRGLLFSSNRHSHEYKIYLREGEGRTVRRITAGPGDDLHAAVDPSGKRIAFSSNRDGAWGLFLLEGIEDDSPARLGDTDTDAIHPAWSPDGRALAYSRRSPVTGEWEVWILDLASSEQRFLTEGLFAEFHPSGDNLVFQRHRRRDRRWYALWTIDLDGTHEREIVAGRDWGAVNPAWSPDGAWVVFNSVAKSPARRDLPPEEGDDIWCVRADGRHLTRLTSRGSPEWNPAWGDDGRIYFSSTHTGETGIWSLRPQMRGL